MRFNYRYGLSRRPSLDRARVAEQALRESKNLITNKLAGLFNADSTGLLLHDSRNVPWNLVVKFIEKLSSRPVDEDTHEAIFHEQGLLAANFALSFGRISQSGIDENNAARLENGAAVAFLCALHRFQTYRINTLVRHRVSAQLSAESLVASYVERSQRQHNIKEKLVFGETEGCLVGLTPRLKAGASLVTAKDDTRPAPQTFWLYNYFPLAIPAETEWQRYAFLDQPSATRHLGGLAFPRWWACWLLLNQIALEWMPRVEENRVDLPYTSAMERHSLDFCIQVHNAGMAYLTLSELYARQAATRMTTPEAPSAEEWDAFIGSVTCSEDSDEVTFVERPYIFYPAGGDNIVWDLLRHGGVLRALERKMSRQRGEFGRLKGGHGETILGRALTAKLPLAAHLKHDITIFDEAGRQPRMQIDHGFVLGEVLVLVETKLQTLNPGYFLADDSFEKRVKERVAEKWVAKRDQKLARFSQQVAMAWLPAKPSMAICVICNGEVEYITSRQAEHWLDIHREIPRVCTPDELLTWLDTADAERLRSHPAAVSLIEQLGPEP